MKYSIISKDKILDVISNPNSVHSTTIKYSEFKTISEKVSHGDILLVWGNNYNSTIPPVWLINDNAYDEILAYLSTYVRNHVPFSGFFRVLPMKYSNLISRQTTKKANSICNSLIGVVIAESLYQYDSSITSITGISVQASLATISAAIVSAIHKGYYSRDLSNLVDNWAKVRNYFQLSKPPLDSRMLQKFWFPVSSLFEENSNSFRGDYGLSSNMTHALKSIMIHGEIKVGYWNDLTLPSHEIGEYFLKLKGPREEAITHFNGLLNLIKGDKKMNETERDIVLGAALSIVSSGSLSLLQWSMNFVNSFPLFPLWYSFFCGFNSRSDIGTIAGGLGNHIAKRILIDTKVFEPPISDISFYELDVLFRANNKIPTFRTTQSSVIDIEILPLVNCKFSVKKNIYSQKKDSIGLDKHDLEKTRELLVSALKILGKGSQQFTQADLFDNTEKTGKNKK